MHPILLRLGPLELTSYGALVAAGWLAGITFLSARRARMGLSEQGFWSLIYWLFGGALVGGKLLYLLVELPALLSGELSLVRDLRFGFVFYGGVLGAMAGGAWQARKQGFSFLAVGDHIAAALPLGHAIGRLGCLLAGCCYGRPTSLPWGLALGGDPASSTAPQLWGVPLHPAQLYESAANLAIFGFIAAWALPAVEGGRLKRGTAFLLYLALYGAARFAVELFRFDDRGATLPPLSPSQWLALALSGAAVVTMWRRGVKA